MCVINQNLTKSKVLISFGAMDGGFEYAWAIKKLLDDMMGENYAYIDAISLENDPSTSYNWNEALAIYKMENPNWETYFKLTMENCETMILLITKPWLESQWCNMELEWLIEELKIRNIKVIPVIFEDALQHINANPNLRIFNEFFDTNSESTVTVFSNVEEIENVTAVINGREHIYHYRYAVDADIMNTIVHRIID